MVQFSAFIIINNNHSQIRGIMKQAQQQIQRMIQSIRSNPVDPSTGILKDLHIKYMNFVLHDLGQSIIHYQNAQPWLVYYIIHTAHILQVEVSQEDKAKMKKALGYCFSQGFGGGYKQLPHLAPTYAAFLAIIELGPDAFELLDRKGLYVFLRKCKKGGRFMMHQLGQCDLRAAFIAVLITKSLKLPEDVLEGVAQTIIASQTYEGGISNVIGGEAHGGFTFCGVAAMALLGRLEDLDISRLMEWLSQRQTQFGGFNGRTNKLVDSCYSHWVGSVFNIVNDYLQGGASIDGHLLYNQQNLQKYVVFFCQDMKKGGLWDKPGKRVDAYHTCYALSGLAASMQLGTRLNQIKLQRIEPVYNVSLRAYKKAQEYFDSLEPYAIKE